jgi:hypothetical protein
MDLSDTVKTLTISGSGKLNANSVTLGGNLVVNGALAMSGTSFTVTGNVLVSGSNASVNFSNSSSKLNFSGTGQTLTINNGATFQQVVTSTAPPWSTAGSLTGTYTLVVDNSSANTSIVYKTQGNFTLNKLPNNQTYGNLKFTSASNSAAIVTLGNDLTIGGSLSFATGSSGAFVWNFGAYKIASTGNNAIVTDTSTGTVNHTIAGTGSDLFTGFSSFNFVVASGACTVNYASTTGTQNVVGGLYQKLAISGGGTKVLTGNVRVTDSLVLAGGTMALGAKTLTAAGPMSASATSYIITDGVGMLQRAVPASGSAIFPIGTASAYAPVSIGNNAAAVDAFSAKVTTDNAGTNSGADRVKLRWTLSRQGTSAYTPAFTWPSSAEGANIASNRSANAKLFDLASPSTAISATLTGSDPYTLTATATSNRNTSFIVGSNATGITDIKETSGSIPGHFDLGQNYPNPFNPTTTISYQLPANSTVSLKVYDPLGREVATLVNARQVMGSYQTTFDASQLSSGVYLYQLRAGNYVQTRKMVLMK